MKKTWGRLTRFLRVLGPGLITGASDDDPSGIATYAVAGARHGFATLWTPILTYPLMAGVQNICARLGLVNGQGLAGILKEYYPRWVLYPSIALLAVANTINIGADLGAIADAVGVVTGSTPTWLVVPVAIAIVAAQAAFGYRRIADILKLLTLALFAYIVDAIIVRPPIGDTLRGTLIPTIVLERDYIATLVAILGTTISPYLFFWQASEEVEEEKGKGKRTKAERRRRTTGRELRDATIDVSVGMLLSNVVMYFVILAAAATLFTSGNHDIRTGADAAEALRPLAGDLAGLLFAAGMIGTGLLAVPVLAGAVAFAVSETFGWRRGYDRTPREARGFYAVIAASTFIGMLINFIGIPPMTALFATAVINGLVAPPLLVAIMFAARSKRVMGRRTIGPVLTALGWTTTVLMTLAAVALLATSL